MNVYQKLSEIQYKLKVSKENYNSFGKYKYRSCEDILEGLKPLLKDIGGIVTLVDNIEQIGDRFYVKSIATFIDTENGESINTFASAREDLDKKGMDLAQVTGSVSSYARKYALNGLFCIDDTKDSDVTNKHGEDTDNDHSDDIGARKQQNPPQQANLSDKIGPPQAKPDSGQKATKAQVADIFKNAAERKMLFPDFDLFKLLDELMAKKSITTKYTYADKEKLKINWTELDVIVIMGELILPF